STPLACAAAPAESGVPRTVDLLPGRARFLVACSRCTLRSLFRNAGDESRLRRVSHPGRAAGRRRAGGAPSVDPLLASTTRRRTGRVARIRALVRLLAHLHAGAGLCVPAHSGPTYTDPQRAARRAPVAPRVAPARPHRPPPRGNRLGPPARQGPSRRRGRAIRVGCRRPPGKRRVCGTPSLTAAAAVPHALLRRPDSEPGPTGLQPELPALGAGHALVAPASARAAAG